MSDYSPEEPVKHTPDGAAIPGSSRRGLSRRRLLQATGAAAGAAAMAGLGRAPRAAAATTAATRSAAAARRTGTIADIKHVVVMMQENRSFDHYFGTLALPGAAGFGDKQAVQFNNGHNIFYQPDASRTDGGYLLPYRMDTTKFNGQAATPTMGYFERQDVPWQQALASAYTIGDHYHCSLLTSTSPNRIMMWAGTNDPDGDHGGPAVNNNGDYHYAYTWSTYPEALQKAGVSWQIYVNNDTDNRFFGDFTDNTLRSFAQFNPANANAENSVPRQGLLARANVLQTHTTPPPGIPNSPANLDYVLKDFIADCAAGLIPEISYVVSPAWWSEHPGSTPNWGAVYVNRVIQALHDNPDLWNSTLLIINYDEANGTSFFDHVLHPVPEPGTPGEGAPGLSPGLGLRVPLILVSPWTRGGWVAKETFDHTSLIQFMEEFTAKSLGKPAISQNISAWRRSICGDLTSAIDFTSFDNSFPELPAPADLLAAVTADAALPSPPEPAPGQQTVPVQSVQGQLKLRPAPYQQHATILVDRSTSQVNATMTNTSSKAANLQAFSGNALATPFVYKTNTGAIGAPYTVSKETGPKTYTVDTTTTGGQYDFAIYGPDHFVRSFAGTVIPDGQNAGQVPSVDAKLGTGNTKTLKITLTNEGRTPVLYTLTPNDYEGEQQTVSVRFGQHVSIAWPTNQYGYYDVIITADTSDTFTYRYAGRIS
jgi:phospholipase C